jgi:uncharacterized protein involved in exopolysaccharide biosynthesis
MANPANLIATEEDGSTDLRTHYETVARDTFQGIWRAKWWIAALVAAALCLALLGLALIEPRYRSEAIIELEFSGEPGAGSSSPPIASLDPIALVESEIRLIRTRGVAQAVAMRLDLDRDPDFTHQSRLSRVLAMLRSGLGVEQAAHTPLDLAVDTLMRQIQVKNEPRSYLISITAISGDPSTAPQLANAIALEYLRSRAEAELTRAEAAAEHAVSELSNVYGPRHPNYLQAQARLENRKSQLILLRTTSSVADVARLAPGPLLLPAGKAVVPSGPNATSVIGLAAGAALVLGIWLSRRLIRPSIRRRQASSDVRAAARTGPERWLAR